MKRLAVSIGTLDLYLAALLSAACANGGTGDAAAIAAERATLAALYNAAGGAEWRRSLNRLSERPLAEWEGVSVDRQGRVIPLT